MALPSYISDHIARAIAWLTSPFANEAPSTLVEFLTAIVRQVQELENEALDVFAIDLGNATGDALDQYGKLVGSSRDGLSDSDYRSIIRVQLLANMSSGTPPEITRIVSDLLGGSPVKYRQLQPAAYALDWVVTVSTSDALKARLIAIVESITPAGVELAELKESTGLAFGFAGDATAGGFGVGAFTTEDLLS